MVRQPGGETLFRKQREREGGSAERRCSSGSHSLLRFLHIPSSSFLPRLLEVFYSFLFPASASEDSFFGGRGGKKEDMLSRGDGGIS